MASPSNAAQILSNVGLETITSETTPGLHPELGAGTKMAAADMLRKQAIACVEERTEEAKEIAMRVDAAKRFDGRSVLKP